MDMESRKHDNTPSPSPEHGDPQPQEEKAGAARTSEGALKAAPLPCGHLAPLLAPWLDYCPPCHELGGLQVTLVDVLLATFSCRACLFGSVVTPDHGWLADLKEATPPKLPRKSETRRVMKSIHPRHKQGKQSDDRSTSPARRSMLLQGNNSIQWA